MAAIFHWSFSNAFFWLQIIMSCFTFHRMHFFGHKSLCSVLHFSEVWPTFRISKSHDVQFACAINQPLLADHWRVHQYLLTARFIAPSIPWGVSASGVVKRKQLLKDHNFLYHSPIFIMESSTFNIFTFQKALHTIHFNLENWFGFGERYLTP